MVEFVIALIGVLVLVAGAIQIQSMAKARFDAMNKARKDAGAAALAPLPIWEFPSYIQDCTAGADQSQYSKDDGHTLGNVQDFQTRIVNYSHPTTLGQQVPQNSFTKLSQAMQPQNYFGLTHGEATTDIPLLPIIREAVYRADSVQVKGEAWLTWTQGIY